MNNKSIIACSTTSKLLPVGERYTWQDAVPRGGQLIQTFTLTPSLPNSQGEALHWKLIDPCRDDREYKYISSLVVNFSVESSKQEREYERAVLIVNLQQNTWEAGTWRFALNGVQAKRLQPDERDVTIEIINSGNTLVSYIQVPDPTDDPIHFGFVASFTCAKSGEVKTYESRDPYISPLRPK